MIEAVLARNRQGQPQNFLKSTKIYSAAKQVNSRNCFVIPSKLESQPYIKIPGRHNNQVFFKPLSAFSCR